MAFNATEDPYEEDEYFVSDADGAATNEAEDEDEDVTIHFSVSVSRGDGHEGLEFPCARRMAKPSRCATCATRPSAAAPGDEDDEDEYFSSYPGPNYDELDESVQEEFHKYLEARGSTRRSPTTRGGARRQRAERVHAVAGKRRQPSSDSE